MTKEYEIRKRDGSPHRCYRIFKIVITIGVFVVAMLFLLMVIFPKGLWVGLFQ